MIVSLGLEPWPFPEPAAFAELQLEDGLLLIGGHTDGRIEVALRSLDDSEAGFVDGFITPPIETRDKRFVILSVTWQDCLIQNVRINGTEVFPTCQVDVLVIEGRVALTDQTEFIVRNEMAREERHLKLQRFSLRPHRKDGGENYLIAALVGETEQIRDLIEAVSQGRDSHVAGLAARLRLLTVDNKSFGLLQHCASFRNLSLILYTNRFPDGASPLNDAVTFMGSVSAKPSSYCCAPVDLDVWLTLPALQLDEKIYSHGDVIKAFGDTVGAHRDRGIAEELEAYQRIRSQSGSRYRDVQKYVVDASKAVLALANFIISERASQLKQV